MVLENPGAMPDDAALLKAEERGRSSGVERNLAKVEVVGSNPIARSIFTKPKPSTTMTPVRPLPWGS